MRGSVLVFASRYGSSARPRRGFARQGRARLRSGLLLGLSLSLAGCGSQTFFTGPAPTPGMPGYVQGFLGGVSADEPRAALVARSVLAEGGNAADAAVALGFALTVTLPSRAGLGGGGACLAYEPQTRGPGHGVPEAVLFLPKATASVPASADRPAAVPMVPRGLFLLHARYGHLPFDQLIAPAERLARLGTPVSRAL
ncbi:MAG TPA: gamma-glutamyltransferase, partial [Acetobacteraceae bacterium]|nr:gamma-glutamyltransferase [Acetobacteraceae bacterium]